MVSFSSFLHTASLLNISFANKKNYSIKNWRHTHEDSLPENRAQIFKLLSSPGIDNKETIPPDNVASGGSVR